MSENNNIGIVKLIREINRIGHKHYGENGDFSHSKYIKECEDELHKFLILYLGKSFLFSTLSYRDRRERKIVNFADPIDKYKYFNTEIKNLFNPIITELLKKIEDKVSFSLTITMLKNEIGPDVFFEGNQRYTIPIKSDDTKGYDTTIHFISLNEIEFEEDFNVFHKKQKNLKAIKFFYKKYKIKKRKAATLLWHYSKMRDKYVNELSGKDFMVHFLRPAFIDFNHNLLLSLATNRCLYEQELSTINLLIYKIVSLMAIEQKIELDKLNSQHSISLTTHGIKSSIREEISKPLERYILKNKRSIPNKEQLVSIKTKSEDIQMLAGIISWLDKLNGSGLLSNKDDNQELFFKHGIDSGYISEYRKSIVFNEIVSNFNKNTRNSKVELSITEDISLYLKVGRYYLSEVFLRLLSYTILENLVFHGTHSKIKDGKNVYILQIEADSKCIAFLNIVDLTQDQIDAFNIEKSNRNRLIGNIGLFNTILQRTNSGEIVDKIIFKNNSNFYKITICQS